MPRRTFTSRFDRGACCAWSALFLAFALGGALNNSSRPALAVAIACVFGAAAAVYARGALRVGLTTDADGLLLRHPIRTRRLRWDEVEDFAVEDVFDGFIPQRKMVARRQDGERIALPIPARRLDVLDALNEDLDRTRVAAT